MTYAVSFVAHKPGPLTRRSTPELGAQKYTGVDVGTVMIVPGGLMPVHAFVELSRRTDPSGWMQSCVGSGQIETADSCFGRQSDELVATRSSPFDFWAQAMVSGVSGVDATATDGAANPTTSATIAAKTTPGRAPPSRRRRLPSTALAFEAWAGATDIGSPRVRRRRLVRAGSRGRGTMTPSAQRGGPGHPFPSPRRGVASSAHFRGRGKARPSWLPASRSAFPAKPRTAFAGPRAAFIQRTTFGGAASAQQPHVVPLMQRM